jgi:hypothetical protein
MLIRIIAGLLFASSILPFHYTAYGADPVQIPLDIQLGAAPATGIFNLITRMKQETGWGVRILSDSTPSRNGAIYRIKMQISGDPERVLHAISTMRDLLVNVNSISPDLYESMTSTIESLWSSEKAFFLSRQPSGGSPCIRENLQDRL